MALIQQSVDRHHQSRTPRSLIIPTTSLIGIRLIGLIQTSLLSSLSIIIYLLLVLFHQTQRCSTITLPYLCTGQTCRRTIKRCQVQPPPPVIFKPSNINEGAETAPPAPLKFAIECCNRIRDRAATNRLCRKRNRFLDCSVHVQRQFAEYCPLNATHLSQPRPRSFLPGYELVASFGRQ